MLTNQSEIDKLLTDNLNNEGARLVSSHLSNTIVILNGLLKRSVVTNDEVIEALQELDKATRTLYKNSER